jgi:hypothetical protein
MNYIHREKNILDVGFCKCVGSQCQKLYCECFKNGRECGSHCRCVSCKNKNEFGIQHISVLISKDKIFIEEKVSQLLSKKRSRDFELGSTREQSNKKVKFTNGYSHADIKKRLKL